MKCCLFTLILWFSIKTKSFSLYFSFKQGSKCISETKERTTPVELKNAAATNSQLN